MWLPRKWLGRMTQSSPPWFEQTLGGCRNSRVSIPLSYDTCSRELPEVSVSSGWRTPPRLEQGVPVPTGWRTPPGSDTWTKMVSIEIPALPWAPLSSIFQPLLWAPLSSNFEQGVPVPTGWRTPPGSDTWTKMVSSEFPALPWAPLSSIFQPSPGLHYRQIFSPPPPHPTPPHPTPPHPTPPHHPPPNR